MSVNRLPTALMMLLWRGAPPAGAAEAGIDVVPPRTELSGCPFRSSAREMFPLNPVSRLPYWSVSWSAAPKGKPSVAVLGGSDVQVNWAGVLAAIVMDVERPEVR